jgi:hypothetical protein
MRRNFFRRLGNGVLLVFCFWKFLKRKISDDALSFCGGGLDWFFILNFSDVKKFPLKK